MQRFSRQLNGLLMIISFCPILNSHLSRHHNFRNCFTCPWTSFLFRYPQTYYSQYSFGQFYTLWPSSQHIKHLPLKAVKVSSLPFLPDFSLLFIPIAILNCESIASSRSLIVEFPPWILVSVTKIPVYASGAFSMTVVISSSSEMNNTFDSNPFLPL